MADRFPSLEDFDEGQTTTKDSTSNGASFLEREKAALGDDADLFSSSNDKQATIEDGDDDLLGGDFSTSAPKNGTQQSTSRAMVDNDDDDLDDFQSSFPAVDTSNTAVGPSGSVTNTTQPTTYNSNSNSNTQDSEPIRAWRAKRDADLAKRDEISQKKKQDTIATARKDIDAFYESYNRKVDRSREQVHKEAEEFLAKREDTTSGGTAWERIAKLSDVHSKKSVGGSSTSADVSGKNKMRELLIDLSKDKNAPGSTVTA